MTLPVPPLDELLYDTDLWSVDASGAFIATVICDSGDDDTYRVYEDELAQLHPSFPDAIRCLVAYSTDGAAGNLVATTLAYLLGNYIAIKGKTGHTYIFKNITDIFDVEPGSPLIRVYGQTMRIEKAGFEYNNVYFVGKVPATNIAFSRENLQKQYPGWEQRLAVAKELGLEREALSKYVFSKASPAVECDLMPQVGFE